MAEQTKAIRVKPMDKLKAVLNVDSVKQQFQNALKENSGAFLASIIDLYGSDTYLQECDPNLVVMEALKAATLKLPINKQLGFAYIVPYKQNKQKGVAIPQFQLGYRGYIQLAMRTGQYRFLNAGVICEGVKVDKNILTGEVAFSGEATSDKAQGYFAYMELLNGFSKTVYMTKAEVEAHAKRYSKSYNYSNSAWQTNFDEMAQKTMIRNLLSKNGILSTEMVAAFSADADDIDGRAATEIITEANQEELDLTTVECEVTDEDEAKQGSLEGPGF